ncbi:hypothetical protein IHE61_04980 [Streptomyces sp. GKU 257-1]|nr:hypothetical protein [Streptomyces sp. GKU 257-1]
MDAHHIGGHRRTSGGGRQGQDRGRGARLADHERRGARRAAAADGPRVATSPADGPPVVTSPVGTSSAGGPGVVAVPAVAAEPLAVPEPDVGAGSDTPGAAGSDGTVRRVTVSRAGATPSPVNSRVRSVTWLCTRLAVSDSGAG